MEYPRKCVLWSAVCEREQDCTGVLLSVVLQSSMLQWNGWFVQSFLCQWEDFLWFFHIFSLKARAFQCMARRQAVEVSCREHHVPLTLHVRALHVDQWSGPWLNSGFPLVPVLESLRKGKKNIIDSQEERFAGYTCWPVLSSSRCTSCLDLKALFTWSKRKGCRNFVTVRHLTVLSDRWGLKNRCYWQLCLAQVNRTVSLIP